MKPRVESSAPLGPLPRVKPGSKSKNQPRYDARAQLARITGVDLVAVTGLSAPIAQTIISEVGTDMHQFPTVKHCCSWLGLAPQQATVATAHTIARVVYHLLKYRAPFNHESAADYERTRRDRDLTPLTRRAHKLGYALTSVKAP